MRTTDIRLARCRHRSLARAIGGIGLALLMVSGHGCCGGDPVTALREDGSQTIAGRVRSVDGASVAGADVALEPLGMTTVTDGAGKFAFSVVSAGEGVSQYVLEVRSEGYETVSLQVVVSPAGTADVNVTMVSISPGSDPDPDPNPDSEPSGVVVTSSSEDEVVCIAPGVELSFTVKIANEGDAAVDGIVLHDTLDTGFRRILSDSDIVVDRVAFPDAVVVLNPDGRSFRVELGTVQPMVPAEGLHRHPAGQRGCRVL